MVAKIPFHGKFVVPGDSGDTPAQGTITITPSNEVRDPSGNVILTMVPRVYELDANGEVSGELYATDDATVPSGWTYSVKQTLLKPGTNLAPAYQRTWDLIVPMGTSGTLELAQVADAQPVSTFVEYATYADLAQLQTDVANAGAAAAGAAQKAANLGDLANPTTARTNLGLGAAATMAVGMSTGTVTAGDDVRVTGQRNLHTIAFVGDSITNNSGAIDMVTPTNNQQWYPKGWGYVANALLGHKLRVIVPGTTGPGSLADPNGSLHGSTPSGSAFALGGMLASELLSLGYMDAAVASSANIIILHAGTNDINSGTDGTTLANTLLTLWRKATAVGKRVVATTILPRDSTIINGTKLTALNLANKLIRQYAAAEPGVFLCDWHNVLLDANAAPPSGGSASAWFLDGLHPNAVGGWRLGNAMAATLSGLVGPRITDRWLPIDPTDVLTPNPFATGNVSGLSTSWTLTTVGAPASGPTATKVARSDLVPGQWQQIAVTATNPASDGFSITLTDSTTSTWAAGDQVYGFAEIQVDAAGWDCRVLQLDVVKSGVATVASANAISSAERTALTVPLSPPPTGGIILITPVTTLDASLTAVRAVLRFWGSGTVRIGRMGVCKV